MIFASGLKYVGVGTYPLGWALGAVLVVAGGYWLVRTHRPNEPAGQLPGRSSHADGAGRAGEADRGREEPVGEAGAR